MYNCLAPINHWSSNHGGSHEHTDTSEDNTRHLRRTTVMRSTIDVIPRGKHHTLVL